MAGRQGGMHYWRPKCCQFIPGTVSSHFHAVCSERACMQGILGGSHHGKIEWHITLHGFLSVAQQFHRLCFKAKLFQAHKLYALQASLHACMVSDQGGVRRLSAIRTLFLANIPSVSIYSLYYISWRLLSTTVHACMGPIYMKVMLLHESLRNASHACTHILAACLARGV